MKLIHARGRALFLHQELGVPHTVWVDDKHHKIVVCPSGSPPPGEEYTIHFSTGEEGEYHGTVG
jgi:hypothetical protein